MVELTIVPLIDIKDKIQEVYGDSGIDLDCIHVVNDYLQIQVKMPQSMLNINRAIKTEGLHYKGEAIHYLKTQYSNKKMRHLEDLLGFWSLKPYIDYVTPSGIKNYLGIDNKDVNCIIAGNLIILWGGDYSLVGSKFKVDIVGNSCQLSIYDYIRQIAKEMPNSQIERFWGKEDNNMEIIIILVILGIIGILFWKGG